MSVRIIGPITTNIDAIINRRVYDVVFGAVEFSNALQYTLLEGPFSLAVDVNNISGLDLYIGVSIQTREQNIILADRKHLIFCSNQDHITLSRASVPALAKITGEVISITVTFYRSNTSITGSNQTVVTSLFLEEYAEPSSPQPYIGRDSIALDTSEYAGTGGAEFTLQNATNAQQIAQIVPVLIYRSRIRSLSLNLFPTPFVGDTMLYAFVGDSAANPIAIVARLYSEQDRVASKNMALDLFLRTNQHFWVLGDNYNTTNDYKCIVDVSRELVH